MAKRAHVSDEKKKIVNDFVKLIEEYPIIGAVDMENLPTKQLQNMRAQLRKTVLLKMTKKRLLKVAIERAKEKKKGIEQLEPYLKGMPALMFTSENPFKIYNKIQQNKSNAPAKAGQTAPRDIVVKAGPTSFAPGPVIGELSSIGVKAGIDAGKVVIKADSVVVREGEIIKANVAALLTRLGIEPMEIGLNVVAVYENGTVYPSKLLAIDEIAFKGNLSQAGSWAFNLAVEIAYPTKDTTETLLQNAFTESKAIALSQGIMAKGIAGDVLAKAEMEMLSLKTQLGL